MQSNGNYILVLPSWYPSEAHKFNGDFNQRFVEAVSDKKRQVVLYIVSLKNIKKSYHTTSNLNNITTYLVYYPSSNIPLFKTLIHLYYFTSLNYTFLKKIIKSYGLPFLIQVYVFWPAGLIAWYLKKRYSLKFIITENWTAFYSENPQNLKKRNIFSQLLYKKVLREAAYFISVANRLKEKIINWTPHSKISVIPNVVNTALFNYDTSKKRNDKELKLIHVSSMKYQKNCEGLLKAFEEAVKIKSNLFLKLIGPVNQNLLDQINASITLKSNVLIGSELEYIGVSQEMKKADVLVMFSRYENLPCVILEALCSGIPVITTDVGGAAEVIDETNGLVIESEDLDGLTQAILEMASNYGRYDGAEISQRAIRVYGYEPVAKRINQLYDQVGGRVDV